MAFATVRVAKIKTISQMQGISLHAQRMDRTSQRRLRAGATPGMGLSWSKATEAPSRDALAAFKAHKAATGAGERKGAPLALHTLCIVSPEWVQEAGGLHDPNNPRNARIMEAAKTWAESWAGEGSVTSLWMDLDENGGGVVDVMISPVRESRGKPQISTSKALQELKRETDERNEYAALQTSWAEWCQTHLDPMIERGVPAVITKRKHVDPDTYAEVARKAQQEAESALQAERRALELEWQALRARERDLKGWGERLKARERRVSQLEAHYRQLRDRLEQFLPSSAITGLRQLESLAYRACVAAGWINPTNRKRADTAPITLEEWELAREGREAINLAEAAYAPPPEPENDDEPDLDGGPSPG